MRLESTNRTRPPYACFRKLASSYIRKKEAVRDKNQENQPKKSGTLLSLSNEQVEESK